MTQIEVTSQLIHKYIRGLFNRSERYTITFKLNDRTQVSGTARTKEGAWDAAVFSARLLGGVEIEGPNPYTKEIP